MQMLSLSIKKNLKLFFQKIEIFLALNKNNIYRYGALFYFIIMFYKLQQVQSLQRNGVILNYYLIEIQRVWFFLLISLFFVTSFYKKSLFNKFIFFNCLVTVLYGIRLSQTYLFQDDWYHTLAITRLGWNGLWIPFVDHITPVWRLIQFVLIKSFGGYDYLMYLPYVGVIGISSLSTLIYYLLKKNQVKLAFLLSMLLVTYPGYTAVMFWISTNAIVYSSFFGVLGIFFQYKYAQNNKIINLFYILIFLILSYLSWTTGLVFTLFSGVLIIINYIEDLINNKYIKFKLKLLLELLPAFFSFILFMVIRNVVFNKYSESYVSQELWVANGMKHGHEQNFLRPIFWPFIAIFDGIVARGIFGKIFLNNNFWEPICRGFLAILFFIYLGFSNIKARWYHIQIIIFLFLSYSVIFLGRGMGALSNKTPHGYLDYAISNDWYRISAITGAIYIFGLASKYYTSKSIKIIKVGIIVFVIPLFLGFYGPNGIFRDHIIRLMSLEVSENYETLSCLKKIGLTQDEFLYASQFVFLPMFKSNPGNFWLSYEPSWFDLFLNGTKRNVNKFNYDQGKQEKIENDLKQVCSNWPSSFEKYVFRSDFPSLEWKMNSRDIFFRQVENRIEIDIGGNAFKELKEHSLLVIKGNLTEASVLKRIILNNKIFSSEFVNISSLPDSDFSISFDLKYLNNTNVLNITFEGLLFNVKEIKSVALPSSAVYKN